MVSGNKNIPQKKQNSQSNPVRKKEQVKPGKSKEQMKDKSSFMDKIDQWLEPHLNPVFYFSLFLTLLVGFFLFDVKISTGGDDSHYIEMANDFLKGRSFPSWHGPLYPIFLSIPMKLFGVKVMLLEIVFPCFCGCPPGVVLPDLQKAGFTHSFCTGHAYRFCEFINTIFCQSNIY